MERAALRRWLTIAGGVLGVMLLASAPSWAADTAGKPAPAPAAQTAQPAAEAKPEVTVTQLVQQKLANAPGNMLTAVKVDLPPGASSPAHHHAGFVFVYVISGKVRSGLNGEEPKVYKAGQSWTEPPGTAHSMFVNPSKKKRARILAVFVAPDGAELTTYDKAGKE